MKDFFSAHHGQIASNGAMDFNPSKQERIEQKINKRIGDALVAENNARGERNYLGGSEMGGACGRALYFSYNKYQVDDGRELTHRALRIFRAGDIFEVEIARWLRLAGFDLRTERKDGSQFEFTDAGGKIKMHLDGVLLSGPVDLPYPVLWECKSAKASKWRAFRKHGIDQDPMYWGQLHTYMGYGDLHHALWTCINKDTEEVMFRLVKFRGDVAQAHVDRSVQILGATCPEEIPRVALDKSNYQCKWCDWYSTCWALDR